MGQPTYAKPMFIQTETTPNPATLKFLPGREVMAEGTADFPDARRARARPWPWPLFAIPGVERVFFGADFITVTKARATDSEWKAHLKPAILGAIMEHFTRGLPLFEGEGAAPTPSPTALYEGETAEIVAQIKELLDTRVRPAVAGDGGDIIFKGFDAGFGHRVPASARVRARAARRRPSRSRTASRTCCAITFPRFPPSKRCDPPIGAKLRRAQPAC